MKNLLKALPSKTILPLFIFGGILAGLGVYTVYMSRAYSYLSDDPKACVNCHIMTSYYKTWEHSSHGNWANCNDCHVPHDNIFKKYAFKAKDGLYHAAVFTLNAEPIAIRPREESHNVIMENCIRCHTQLNTEFVKTGMISYTESQNGKGKACWDCHVDVPHTKRSSILSTPNSVILHDKSTQVPEWLQQQLKK